MVEKSRSNWTFVPCKPKNRIKPPWRTLITWLKAPLFCEYDEIGRFERIFGNFVNCKRPEGVKVVEMRWALWLYGFPWLLFLFRFVEYRKWDAIRSRAWIRLLTKVSFDDFTEMYFIPTNVSLLGASYSILFYQWRLFVCNMVGSKVEKRTKTTFWCYLGNTLHEQASSNEILFVAVKLGKFRMFKVTRLIFNSLYW